MAKTEMHTAWNYLIVDFEDTALRKSIRRACKTAENARIVAVVRFFERYVQGMEDQLRRRDQKIYPPTPEIHGGVGKKEGGIKVYSR